MTKVKCLLVIPLLLIAVSAQAEVPLISVGMVGHDHQVAAILACLEGELFQREYGFYLKPVIEKRFYDFYDGKKKIAEIEIIEGKTCTSICGSIAGGALDIGLSGIGPIVFMVDKGKGMKCIAPLQSRGNIVVVHPSVKANSWAEFCDWIKTNPRQVRFGYRSPTELANLIVQDALRAAGISFTIGPSKVKPGSCCGLFSSPSIDHCTSALGKFRSVVGQSYLAYGVPWRSVPLLYDGSCIPLLSGSDSRQKPKAKAKAKVRFINMKGDKFAVPALANHIIDAYAGPTPWAQVVVHKGIGKKICNVHDLPPGIWRNHPCCAIGGSEKVIRDYPEVGSKYLELLNIGSKIAKENPELAARDAAAWMKTPLEVERKAIPAIGFSLEPDKDFKDGTYNFYKVCRKHGYMKGKLKKVSKQELEEVVYDFTLLERAKRDLERRMR